MIDAVAPPVPAPIVGADAMPAPAASAAASAFDAALAAALEAAHSTAGSGEGGAKTVDLVEQAEPLPGAPQTRQPARLPSRTEVMLTVSEEPPVDEHDASALPADDQPRKAASAKPADALMIAPPLPDLRLPLSVTLREPQAPPAEGTQHRPQGGDPAPIERPVVPVPTPPLPAALVVSHAPPPHALALSQHASSLEFADALAQLTSRGERPTRLEVAGDALGAVSIEVVQQPQGLSVAFDTPSEAARAALDAAQPRLIADARAAGLSFTQSSVGGDRRERRRAQVIWPIEGGAPPVTLATTATSADRYA